MLNTSRNNFALLMEAKPTLGAEVLYEVGWHEKKGKPQAFKVAIQKTALLKTAAG